MHTGCSQHSQTRSSNPYARRRSRVRVAQVNGQPPPLEGAGVEDSNVSARQMGVQQAMPTPNKRLRARCTLSPTTIAYPRPHPLTV